MNKCQWVSLLLVVLLLGCVNSLCAETTNAVLDTPGSALDVAAEGSHAFVADGAGGLRVVDVTVPSSPQEVAATALSGTASGIALYGSYALVASGSSGIQIIDISSADNPQPYATLPVSGTAQDINIVAPYAYIAAGAAGIHILALHDMLSPYVVSTLDTQGTSQALTVIDDLAYIADGTGGLKMVDVGNPILPTLIGGLSVGSAVQKLSVAGEIVYLSTQAESLVLVDVSDPTEPELIETQNPGGQTRSVAVAGELIYVADRENGLRVLSNTNTLPGKILTPNGGETLIAGQAVPISWSAVTGAQDYQLFYTFGDGLWNTITTVSGATSFNWQTPSVSQPEEQCRVRLKATNSSGELISDDLSDDDFTISFSAGSITSLSVPASSSSSTVSVSWAASSVAGVQYELTMSKDGSPFESIYKGSSLAIDVAGLTNGSYKFKVRAVKSGYIDGAWSDVQSTAISGVVGDGGAACGMPSNIVVPTTSDNGMINVAWDASSTDGVTYIVEMKSSSGSIFVPISIDPVIFIPVAISGHYTPVYQGSASSVSIPVTKEGAYSFRVKAIKSGLADSGWTLSSECQSVLGAPGSMVVQASSSDGSMALSWGASNTPNVEYVVEMTADNGASYTQVYKETATSAVVTVGSDGTFGFRVKAVKENYTDSAWVAGGNCVVVRACSRPTSINATAYASAQKFTVNWAASATSGVTYSLEMSSNGGSTYSQVYSGGGLSADVPVTSSGSYRFRVKATKAGMQESSWKTSSDNSITLIADTVTLTAPATDSDGAYTVSWTASQQPGATYVVQEAQDNNFTTAFRTIASYTTATSVAITGRADYAKYYYRVKVVVPGMTDSYWSVVKSTEIAFPTLPKLLWSTQGYGLWDSHLTGTHKRTSKGIVYNYLSFPAGTVISGQSTNCSFFVGPQGFTIGFNNPGGANEVKWSVVVIASHPKYRGTSQVEISGKATWPDGR